MNGVMPVVLILALTAALVPTGVHLGFRARCVCKIPTLTDHSVAFYPILPVSPMRAVGCSGHWLFGANTPCQIQRE